MTVRVEGFEEVGAGVLGRMCRLRGAVYAGDRDYCPPERGALAREVQREAGAEEQRLFVARRSGEDRAFALVRRSSTLTLDGASVATIGPFEAKLDSEATGELLRACVAWALDGESDVVIGPMNGDTWHRYRFNLGPRDDAAYLLEPYNPAYYPQMWAEAGFEMLQTYHSRRVDDLEGAAESQRERWDRALSQGYEVVPMGELRFEEALDRVYDMVRVIFRDNFLYTPIPREEFKALYDGAELLLRGKMSFLMVGPSGDDAGFAFVLPDYQRAVVAMKGRRDLWAKIKFALNRCTDTANFKTMGVMPEHRGRGLSSAIAYRCFRGMLDEGFRRTNICLIHDGNVGSIKLDGGRGRVLRRYGLYRW